MIDSNGSTKALVDTNVLIYAYDLDEPPKHVRAESLLEQLSNSGRLVFSAQVFNEFRWAMTRPKRRAPLTPGEVAVILRE